MKTKWNIDGAHSGINFSIRHMVVSKVRGRFGKFSGSLDLDEADLTKSTLDVTIDASSIDTGVGQRDDHLRSDDFFNAEKFPKLKLVLKSIKWAGDKFTATVALTIRDVTKDVKFAGELLGVQTVNFGQGAHQRAGYEARATINRKDFGLKFAGLAEGLAIAGDEVEIQLTAEISVPKPQ